MQRSLRQNDHPQRHPAAPTSPVRNGFSLIELIGVIIVIAILAAMLLPAIGNVRRTARVAQVTTEIKNLEAAIATFKLKYGVEPPSSFLISNQATDYQGASALDVGKNSLAIMRQIWPTFDPLGTNAPATRMGITERKFLNGSECLAFFLGGPGLYTSTGNAADCAPLGFSANPIDPFATGGTRTGPFYEFDASRLVDSDSDGFYELIDQLPGQTAPYVYLSSYNGRGYQPKGYNNTAGDDDDETPTGVNLTYAYFKSISGTSPAYWNAKTYQIISPGFDSLIGTLSCYRDQKFYDTSTGKTEQQGTLENDNITNFSGGMLVPR